MIRWRSNPSARRLWGMHAPTASSKPCNWSIRMPDPTAIDPLEAESIAYSKIGASGVFFADLIQRLGIAKDVNAKAQIIPSGFTAELVASGEAELAVQQASRPAAPEKLPSMGAGREGSRDAGRWAGADRHRQGSRDQPDERASRSRGGVRLIMMCVYAALTFSTSITAPSGDRRSRATSRSPGSNTPSGTSRSGSTTVACLLTNTTTCRPSRPEATAQRLSWP